MLGKAPTGFLDNRDGIAAGPELDVQVQVPARRITQVSEELRKGALALSFDTDEDNLPLRDRPTPTHLLSTNLGNAAENAGAVLGVEPRVATQAAHVLRAVDARRAIARLLDDKELFLLQIVQQTHVVGSD